MKRWMTIAAMGSLLALAAPAAGATSGAVTNLRVDANSGQTELTIEIRGGEFRWSDFTLSNPTRVVVDITGARSSLPGGRYEGIGRGGISALRTSQYSADVVRVVVDLERTAGYEVSRVPEGLRVSFRSRTTAFEPWSAQRGGASPTAQPAANTTRQAQQQRRQARPITVSFYETDIRDVLASFAEYTGRSIIAGSGVEGTVTADIVDQPWDVALETLMRAYGFAVEEMPSGIIRVDAIERLAARRTQEPLVTQTFRINYVPVAELVTTLTPLKTERGTITSNPSTNTLIVTDVEGVVNNVSQLVSQLDIRTQQVAIQAKIIFVNRTDVEELGVTYDLKDSRGNQLNRASPGFNPETGEVVPLGTDLILLGGNSIAALGNANARVTGASLETLISLTLGRFSLVAFLDALRTRELADVQAEPLITTLNNQEAEILVGERTPIRVVDLATPGGAGGGAGTARATAQLVETGIRLRVTPYITGDRRILMQLRAERSSAQLAATDIGVVFQTQEGNTRLLVNDGETAVIGGLTVTEVTQTRAGIPLLMDIPYLGALFRTTRNREQKRDLLIMVTPHIVEERD